MKKIKTPDGYRLLKEGEIIKSGDVYTIHGRVWLLSTNAGIRWNPKQFWPTARKIESIGERE